MLKNDVEKEEWKMKGLSLFEAVFSCIIREQDVKKTLRVEIVPEPLNDELILEGCSFCTWREEQKYQFYKKENENSPETTVICVYQKHMSREYLCSFIILFTGLSD